MCLQIVNNYVQRNWSRDPILLTIMVVVHACVADYHAVVYSISHHYNDGDVERNFGNLLLNVFPRPENNTKHTLRPRFIFEVKTRVKEMS